MSAHRYPCQTCPHLGASCHGEQALDLSDRCENTDPDLCWSCQTPCCRFPRFRDEAIARAGGLELETWPALPLPPLPRVIPVLKGGGAKGARNSAWILKGSYVLRSKGWTKNIDLKERLGIEAGELLGLDWFTHDDDLDRLLLQDTEALADAVERMGIDFMIAPNFSTYTDTPPLFNALNLRNRTRYASAVAARGVPVIPDVSAHYPLHYYRLLSKMRGHEYATFNLQTSRQPTGSEGFTDTLSEMRWTYRRGGWKMLCVGAWSRIPAILEAWPGAVIRTAKLYQQSEFKKDLQGRKIYGSTAEAFRENLAALYRKIEAIEATRRPQQLTICGPSDVLPSKQFKPTR